MKLQNKLIFCFIIFNLFINPTYADTNISLDCPANSTVGKTINCTVIANSDIELSAISTKLKVSDNLKLVKFTTDSSWQGNGDEGNIELYTYPNQKGVIKLGVAEIKIVDNKDSKTGTISLKNTIFYQASFSGIKGNNYSKNIKILSTNNNLSNITLNKGNYSPAFNKNIYKYQATIDSNTLIIEATPEDKTASLSGTGKKELKYGENVFTITVTNELGQKKEYQIIITRPQKEENNNKKEEVSESTKKEEPTINNNNNPVTPPNQETTSQNPEEKDPETKEPIKLKELTIEGYQLEFQEDKTNYSLELIHNEKKLNIAAIPTSNNIKVTISGNDNLKSGTNKILITLESEDGSKKVYTIIATKKENTCIIKNITISGYNFDFTCDKYDYELKIKNEESLNIEVIPINKNTKINIYNNDNLQDNDIITISVKQGDNKYKYSIKINKHQKIIENKKILIPIIITVIGLLYIIIRFIIKKKHLNKF